MKLGSLFDGIGGFPLAATRHNIDPVWASEIEPFPIRVTQHRFPNMKHLGDITKINGAEIEPVDVITFGSPCQDLSVAGKREGLAGARSGLFMDAIRIIRGMREASNGCYPRFAVWENVPGAYSSNGGQDFRAVLEEITEAEIPMPRSGKWATAGMVRTKRVDVAWRTLDAQYWGVPQRRKRIFLVADFGGQCAGEILFECESMSGHFAESREKGQGITSDAETGSAVAMRMREGCAGGGKGPLISENKSLTLGCNNDQTVFAIDHVITTGGNCTAQGPCVKENGPMFTLKAAGPHAIGINGRQDPCCYGDKTGALDTDGLTQCVAIGADAFGEHRKYSQSVTTRQGSRLDIETGTFVLEPTLIEMTSTKNTIIENGICPTLTARMGTGGNQVNAVMNPVISCASKQISQNIGFNVAMPVMANDYKEPQVICAVDSRNLYENEELSGTLQAKENGGYSLNYINPIRLGYAVRRLTPLECERLQGFPDNWTNIEGAKDTARYKAIGNSVAIPCVEFIIQRISEILTR